MIEELLTLENINVNVKVNDWVDAITKGGNILLKNKKIEKKYIEAMIENVKTLGPYIVMVPGVAMPHARPELGAKSLGLSVITLKDPVNFGNEELDPINIVFVLCAKDNKSHLNLLQDLSCIMEEPDLSIKAKECNTKEELINLLLDFYKKNK